MDIERIVFHITAQTAQYFRQMDTLEARTVATFVTIGASAAKMSIQMASEFQRTSMALEIMTKDAVEGKRIMKEIVEMAVTTPFKSQELVSSAKQLKSFGIENENLMDTLKVLGEVSAGTGTSIERIGLAYGQVRVAGKLLGTELRQFIDAGVPLIETLADVMGKPKEAMRALVEQGHVGFREVVMAFNAMTTGGGIYAGMMKRVNEETFAGRWQSFAENVEILERDFALAAFEGLGILEILRDMGDVVQGWRNSDNKEIVQFFRSVKAWLVAIYETSWMIVKPVYEWYKANKALILDIWHIAASIDAVYWSFAGLVFLVGRIVPALQFFAWLTGLRSVWLVTVSIVGALRAVWVWVSAIRVSTLLLLPLFAAWRSLTLGFSAISGLVSGIGALASAIGPLGILLAMIGGMGYLMYQEGVFDGVAQDSKKTIQLIAQDWIGLWQGLKDAFNAGDMNSVFSILGSAFVLTFHRAFTEVSIAWKKTVFGFTSKENPLGFALLSGLDTAGAETIKFGARLMNSLGLASDEEYSQLVKNVEAQHQNDLRLIEEGRKLAKNDPAAVEQRLRFEKEIAEFRKAKDMEAIEMAKQLNAEVAKGKEALVTKNQKDWVAAHSSEIREAYKIADKWYKDMGVGELQFENVVRGHKFNEKGLELQNIGGMDFVEADFDKAWKAANTRSLEQLKMLEEAKKIDAALQNFGQYMGRASLFYGPSTGEKLYNAAVDAKFPDQGRIPFHGAEQWEPFLKSVRSVRMPTQLSEFAAKMGDALGLPKGFIPSPMSAGFLDGKNGVTGIGIPQTISASARDSANKLLRDINNGFGPLDTFKLEVKNLREAWKGIGGIEAENPDFVGPLQYDPRDPRRFMGGLLTKEELVAGEGKAFEALMKSMKSDSERLAPNLVYGSSAAQDAINAYRSQNVTTQDTIVAVLTEALTVQKENLDFSRRVTEGIEEIRKKNPMLVEGAGFGPKN